MAVPENIDKVALGLLETHGYAWDSVALVFRRVRRVDKQSFASFEKKPVVITFEELRDHELIGGSQEPQDVLNNIAEDGWSEKGRKGREWLTEKLKASDLLTE